MTTYAITTTDPTTGAGAACTDVATFGTAPVWGAVTGTLANQTDLQSALNGKQAAGSYATAAQGTKADTATQPADLAAGLATKQAAGSYASGAQGALADTAVQPAGLTKAAVGLGNADNTADSAKVVASAAKLTTARTINNISFDGTQDINIPMPVLAGPQGTPGSLWRTGPRVPSPSLGVNGDFYLNSLTKAVSQKVKGVYALVCNLAPVAPRLTSSTLLHRF